MPEVKIGALCWNQYMDGSFVSASANDDSRCVDAANTERWRERFGRGGYLLDGGSSARSRRPALGHHA